MAYTICDQGGNPKPIRLLVTKGDEPVVGGEFRPYWWVCDPCNPSASRYEVEHNADQAKPTEYAWYQVITSEDGEEDIALKVGHYRKVIMARRAVEEAEREYRRLA